MLIARFFADVLGPEDERPARACEATARALGLPYNEPFSAPLMPRALSNGGIEAIFGFEEQRFARLVGVSWNFGKSRALFTFLEFSALDDLVARAEAATWEVGSALEAWSGALSHDETVSVVTQQTRFPGGPEPPLGLPPLEPCRTQPFGVPPELGWINYWSDDAAAKIGFPDPARDQDLLSRTRRLDGAWVIRLTEEPLDLHRSEHIEILKAAYRRFPAIGRRAD